MPLQAPASPAAPPVAAPYVATRWGVEEGLPHSAVTAVLRAREGYVWVGTRRGLARFDGRRFTVFDGANTPALGQAHVRALAEGGGGLWVATTTGLARYADGRWRAITAREGLPGAVITALAPARRDGALWVGTFDGGVARVSARAPAPGVPGEHWQVDVLRAGVPAGPVYAIRQDRAGAVWAATYGGGLARLAGADGRGGRTLTTRDGLPDDRIWALAEGRGDTLWVGTERGLAAVVAGRVVPLPRGLRVGGRVSALYVDGAGALWVGTIGAGVRRLATAAARPVDARGALAGDVVGALGGDAEGNVWVGTALGLARVRRALFRRYAAADGLPRGRVGPVLDAPNGDVWVGMLDGGLARLTEGGARAEAARRPALRNAHVTALARRAAGGLWIGTFDGRVLAWDGPTVAATTVAATRVGGEVMALAEAPGDTLWVGTSTGLHVAVRGRLVGAPVGEPARAAGAAAAPVLALHRDRAGRLWAGTTDGLAVWDRGGLRPAPGAGDALAGRFIYAMHEDAAGALWLATSDGLSRVAGGRVATVGRADGLFDDALYAVREDGAGYLWCTSARGIFRVRKADVVRALAAGHSAHARAPGLVSEAFGATDGLASAEPTGGVQPSSWRASDGRLWFPTTAGAVAVDPADVPPPRAAPPARIEEVAVDGERRPSTPAGDSAGAKGAAALRLAPDVRRVEVGFVALAASTPGDVRLRYRLDPFDRGWVDALDRRTAVYTALPPGRYRFRVAALNAAGAPGAEDALAFEVRPHLYQTWWCLTLGALAAASALAAAVRLRERRLARRVALVLAERTRIAGEVHDTLLQDFVGITLELQALSVGAPDAPAPLRRSLDGLVATATRALTVARLAVWDLGSPDEAEADLPAALEAVVARALGGDVLRCAVRLRGTPRPIAPPVATQVCRIVQEALVNAARHARASAVEVEVAYDLRAVRVSVRDDGRGFAPDHARRAHAGHWGLTGMRARAARIGAEFALESAPGAGTVVRVVLPNRAALAR